MRRIIITIPLLILLLSCGGAGGGTDETSDSGDETGTVSDSNAEAGATGANSSVNSVLSNLGLGKTGLLIKAATTNEACDNVAEGGAVEITDNEDGTGILTYNNCDLTLANRCDSSETALFTFEGTVEWEASTADLNACSGLVTVTFFVDFIETSGASHEIRGIISINLDSVASCNNITCEDYVSNVTIDGQNIDLCANLTCDETDTGDSGTDTEGGTDSGTDTGGATTEVTCDPAIEAFSGVYEFLNTSCANTFEDLVAVDFTCSDALGWDEFLLAGTLIFDPGITGNYVEPASGVPYFVGNYSADIGFSMFYTQPEEVTTFSLLLITFYDGVTFLGDRICDVTYIMDL